MNKAVPFTSLIRAGIEGVASVAGTAARSVTCWRNGQRPLVVLDIDNTIADAWPSFGRQWGSERERLGALEPLPHIKAVAHDAPISDGAGVMFLTHRHLWHWLVTYRWLKRHGFDVRISNLVLVADPSQKVAHLRRCAEGRRVTYWDDLSKSHESGEIEFYSDVIGAVESIDLEYLGWNDIVAVTGRGLDRYGGPTCP